MSRSTFIGNLLGCAALVVFLGLASDRAVSQVPTADQAELFQNLDPDAQRSLLDAVTGQGGGGRGGTGVRQDRRVDFPKTSRPRSRADRMDDDDDYYDDERDDRRQRTPADPRLRPDDTIIISLDIKTTDAPPPVEQPKPANSNPLAPGQPNPLLVNPNGQSIPGQMPGTQPLNNSAQGTPIARNEDQTRKLRDFRDRIQRRNPYRLNQTGVLTVPELGPIPLAGLTVTEAIQRLGADIALADFNVKITRLPLWQMGPEGLKPFGYDLFSDVPTTFAPATDIPVPAEYVVGPGDIIEIQLIGNTKGRYKLSVGRDGKVNFPELGPISVSGLRFDAVRTMIEDRVRQQMIGTQVSVGIGELRSIRIFVLGEAETPGSYTVSGLSTITNALFVSGGIKKIGSLRNIELKRGGYTVRTLDLYDLLLKGDTRADVRLLPGDVIFIPPIGTTVGISGEVRRPAIYELKNENSAAELIKLSGGLTPRADAALATLDRVSEQRQRVTIEVNLQRPDGKTRSLQTGDVLKIPTIRPVLEESVTLVGNVYRPGEFQFKPGMRLTDVLPTMDELKANADRRYLLIRRELPPDRRVSVFSADLEFAIGNPASAANFELSARDQIYVFDMESGRDRIIEPLLRELQMQSQIDEPTREVNVAGKIKVPGKYPFESGMRIADLLRAGGGLDEAAYGAQAELTRYVIINGERREAKLIPINLKSAVEGDPRANLPLQPFDYLMIKELPLWATQEEVDIRGEVRFPGKYPIARGETFRSVLERAGGLTDFAFAEGAVFTRKELRERERKQIDTLTTRLQNDLAQVSLLAAKDPTASSSEALAAGQSLLANLRSTEAVGRLVIDLEKSAKAEPGSELDIVLKDGDRLLVPRVSQEVTVIGEVQSATSHLYKQDLTRNEYIAASGGLTPRASEKGIYIVRADGSVVTGSGRAWFLGGGAEIKPGDTVVVPLDTDRVRTLSVFQSVSTIVYNLAIAVAAVNSF